MMLELKSAGMTAAELTIELVMGLEAKLEEEWVRG
jgi:hypothetical protein